MATGLKWKQGALFKASSPRTAASRLLWMEHCLLSTWPSCCNQIGMQAPGAHDPEVDPLCVGVVGAPQPRACHLCTLPCGQGHGGIHQKQLGVTKGLVRDFPALSLSFIQ